MTDEVRVIISLTTTPHRIHAIRAMLLDLSRQDEDFAEILLNVPYRSRRTGEPYAIPDWMASIPKLRIHRCTDHGPATKLLGALERENDPDTLIITVDDDVTYPPGMVAAYRRIARQGPGCVYCTAGFDISCPFAFAVAIRGSLVPVRGHLSNVQVVEGFGSCLYVRSFFDDSIYPPATLPDCLRYSDDIYISNYLAGRGIDRKTVQCGNFGGPGFWRSRTLPYGFGADALHLNGQVGTNRERYAQGVDYLIGNNIYYLGDLPGRPPRAEVVPDPCRLGRAAAS
jgi:hypothetical protein